MYMNTMKFNTFTMEVEISASNAGKGVGYVICIFKSCFYVL